MMDPASAPPRTPVPAGMPPKEPGTGWIPLARLLEGGRPLDQPVALAGHRIHTYGDFLRGAAAVAEHARRRGAGRWLLACEDPWRFVTGLFGLLQADCTVSVPPNHLPATLERLGSGLDGVLTGREHLEPGPLPRGPLPGGRLEFWTSGSTGEAKRIPKLLSQLEEEIRVLERAFGPRFQGGAVLGTVPLHHIYGFTFRLLWPLALGRTVALEPLDETAGIPPLPPGKGLPALISSPALLSRLPRLMDLDAHAPLAAVAFSSGGPLAREDALAWHRWVPSGVVEVFGSTETNGVAWRIQGEEPDSDLWIPLPDVTLALEPDGALRVQSPRGGPLPQRMEDAARLLPDGRFRLLGRLDRIVKLEEKRIALPELEEALGGHPWVDRAAVVLLGGKRPALGAVVVLSREGRTEAGKGTDLPRTLRNFMAGRFEGVAVPRRWRFPEALPLDAHGKLPARALAALFDPAPEGNPLPPILARHSGEEEIFELGLPGELLAFQGHFPGHPILPGVVQVDWAIRLGAQAFGELGAFRSVNRLKFLAPILPETPLRVHLSLDAAREKLRFEFRGEAGRLSQGTVILDPRNPRDPDESTRNLRDDRA